MLIEPVGNTEFSYKMILRPEDAEKKDPNGPKDTQPSNPEEPPPEYEATASTSTSTSQPRTQEYTTQDVPSPASPTPSVPSTPAQPAPNGQTVNYVVVNRPLGSIDCSYILDPSLRIPTRFLSALDVGESEADRKNLVLKSKLGTIVANIALYHQTSSPVAKRTTMEFKTTVGTMVLKIDDSQTPTRAPFYLRAVTQTGTVILSMPRSFRGFVSVTTTIGAVSLSREVSAMSRWQTDTARVKKCFIGDCSGLSDAELDAWNGDEVVIETAIGSVELSYVSPPRNSIPGAAYTLMMGGIPGVTQTPPLLTNIGSIPHIPGVPGLGRRGFGATVGFAQLTSPLGPVVDLGYAAFAGNVTPPSSPTNPDEPVVGPVTFFGTIPYAKPPLGDLRWRAPQMLDEEASPNGVVFDARNWGPPCIQRPAVVGVGSEDCLTLDIWKPTNASEGDKLPVAVYIHGGGFYANSPQGFPLYQWVAQHPTGLVGVSIAYRLGMMGFLGGPTIPFFSPDRKDADLNVGLLDQRAALEWVQRHISKFGGDPDNVSIFGESAGGASVLMQVTAYGGTKPVPFRRATPQSIGYGPTMTNQQIEQNFLDAAKFMGCPMTLNDSSTLSCMRNASVGAIVSATNRTPNGSMAPVVEGPGGFLPDLPSRLIAAGNFSAVEYMGGHCTGDGKTFAGGSPDQFVTEDDVKRIVFSRWSGVSDELRDEALAHYPLGDAFPTQWDRAWNMAGQAVFTCMDWHLAEGLVKKGVKSAYAYAWNAPDRVLYDQRPYLGAMHVSDLYFLFEGTNTFGNAGNTFTPFNSSEALVAKESIAYWTSFATSGNPSDTKLAVSPSWESYVSESGRRIEVTRGDDKSTLTGMEEISAEEIERCEFWMSEKVTEQTRV
ncbi:hypothetical protein VNI00_012303 [Paramarasmius palmivorus]|uniref:Carboxylesterase type B domain-containing protein n=1 Tax=Paramarasmius palmivorus TaxID=297713 RepID=A0AAW0C6S8_9AGAR